MLKQRDLFTDELHPVPAYFPDDIVTDSFGNSCRYAELQTASDGTTFADEDNFTEYQHELWDEQIDEFLSNHESWVDDYVRSSDYGSEYFYLVSESYAHRGCDAVEEWIRDELGEIPQNVVDRIHDNVIDYADADCVDEYSRETYHVNLDSFQVGEHEDQLELTSCEDLQGIPLAYLQSHSEIGRNWSGSQFYVPHHISADDKLLIEFSLRCELQELGYCADELEFWQLCHFAGVELDSGRMESMPCGSYSGPTFYLRVNTGMRWDYGLDNSSMAQCVADAYESCEIDIPDNVAGVLLDHGAELPE